MDKQHTTGNRKEVIGNGTIRTEAEIKVKLIHDMYRRKTKSYRTVRDIAILFWISIVCLGLAIIFIV